MTQPKPRRWPSRPRRTGKLDALDLAPLPSDGSLPAAAHARSRRADRAFLGDRDEAFRLLRALRIPAYDPERPVRVPVDRVRAWQAQR